MSSECESTPTTPTAMTPMGSRCRHALQKAFLAAWTCLKNFVTHALNSDDPLVDLDALAFCVLFPFSIYWLQVHPHIDGNWAAAFATIWAAVKLSNFRRRPGGDS